MPYTAGIDVVATRRGTTRAQLGYGTARLLMHADKVKAVNLLDAALDAGIRHIDVARSYGDGRAEAVVGEVARRRRPHMTIVTKAGLFPPSLLSRGLRKAFHLTGRARDAAATRSFEPRAIRQSVEQSLRSLKTDYLDALLLHGCRASDISDELRAELAWFKRNDVVRRVGVAGGAIEVSAIAASYPDLADVLQIPAAELDQLQAPMGALIVTHSVFSQECSRQEPVASLDEALARNAGGVVLFSSSNPRHIETNGALTRFATA